MLALKPYAVAKIVETNHLTVGISLLLPLANTTDSQNCLYTSGNNNASCLLIVPATDLADLQNANSIESSLVIVPHLDVMEFSREESSLTTLSMLVYLLDMLLVGFACSNTTLECLSYKTTLLKSL